MKHVRKKRLGVEESNLTETKKKELKKLNALLNLVYQMEIENIININWWKLSEEEVISYLLQHHIDAEFIKTHYKSEIEKMERRLDEIQIFVCSRPK